MNSSILVTGTAGFIGMHTAKRLLERGERVVGLDNFNSYYDVKLKRRRISVLEKFEKFTMNEGDVSDVAAVDKVLRDGVGRIIHLAAQAGVRYSLENPFAYEKSNVAGHLVVLESARKANVKHFVYASSSSVYGDRPLSVTGFSEEDPVTRPASLYAATKLSCEMISASYSNLYSIRQSGLRFFTVYGPWGRPDMAYFRFIEKMSRGAPIEVYGEGRMARDFTYIDDIVDGIVGVLDDASLEVGHEVYNIGSGNPVGLLDMIHILESCTGMTAQKNMMAMQPGDVTSTFADITKLTELTGFTPKVKLDSGLRNFAAWWRAYQES